MNYGTFARTFLLSWISRDMSGRSWSTVAAAYVRLLEME